MWFLFHLNFHPKIMHWPGRIQYPTTHTHDNVRTNRWKRYKMERMKDVASVRVRGRTRYFWVTDMWTWIENTNGKWPMACSMSYILYEWILFFIISLDVANPSTHICIIKYVKLIGSLWEICVHYEPKAHTHSFYKGKDERWESSI